MIDKDQVLNEEEILSSEDDLLGIPIGEMDEG